jgi:glycosyltransferase involved in cell wall biosynthesis
LQAPRIDIVLPCYNPGSDWHSELISFSDFTGAKYALSFIIVDDGSANGRVTPGIDEIKARGIPVQLISLGINRGKGFALRQGVKAAEAPFILYTDIDFPFTNESVAEVLATLVTGRHNIVAGFRGGNYYSNSSSWFRKWLSQAFRFFLKRALRLPVTDTQCGLKAFDRKGREKFLATTIDRYLFDFEFIYSSVKDRTVRTAAVPVKLKEGVVFTSMRTKILLQESANLIRVLLKK